MSFKDSSNRLDSLIFRSIFWRHLVAPMATTPIIKEVCRIEYCTIQCIEDQFHDRIIVEVSLKE